MAEVSSWRPRWSEVAKGLCVQYNQRRRGGYLDMKKFLFKLVLLLVFGVAAYGLFIYFVAPEQAYCTRLVQLCEVEGQEAMDTCTDVLGSVAEKNATAIRDAATCAVEADSCTKAAGCLFGAGSAIGFKEVQKLVPLVRQSPAIVEDFLESVKKGAGDLLR